jgi:hypothetical protein
MDRISRSLVDAHPRGQAASSFALYVEGPSDWHILRLCARRTSPRLSRVMDPHSVILGGRQPARAVFHFRRLRESNASARGLCVLDRDHEGDDLGMYANVTGLRFYTWPRRHIESYLLVPGAIGRSAGLSMDDARFRRAVEDHLPTGDGEDLQAYRSVDAKKLLSPRGPLSRALGESLSVARVAQALHAEEIHPDILELLALVRGAIGAAPVESR